MGCSSSKAAPAAPALAPAEALTLTTKPRAAATSAAEAQPAIARAADAAPADVKAEGGHEYSSKDAPAAPALAPAEALTLTTEHCAAAATSAAEAQAAIARAADAAPADVKAKEGHEYMNCCGGPLLEPLLEHTDLIDVNYLIALAEAGGVVPAWRDVPDCARINGANVWRLRCWNEMYSLPVLVLSCARPRHAPCLVPAMTTTARPPTARAHRRPPPRAPRRHTDPWLDKEHPDRLGETLRRILPILRACRDKAREFGEHATVGVLWDYLSLPQGADRTEAELARFGKGLRCARLSAASASPARVRSAAPAPCFLHSSLTTRLLARLLRRPCLSPTLPHSLALRPPSDGRSINEWYVHPFAPVLLVTTPLPTGAEYTNRRAYDARGWCFFERRISSVVKEDRMLWDLSLHEDGKAMTYDNCQTHLKSSRHPFMSPERVARELREGVEAGTLGFTAGLKDLELVSGLYERGFVKAFETFRQSGGVNIYYNDLGWGSKEAPILAEALAYAHEHCKPPEAQSLDMENNEFTEAEKLMLRKALPDASRFELSL